MPYAHVNMLKQRLMIRSVFISHECSVLLCDIVKHYCSSLSAFFFFFASVVGVC